jgi:hypothetical protein
MVVALWRSLAESNHMDRWCYHLCNPIANRPAI